MFFTREFNSLHDYLRKFEKEVSELYGLEPVVPVSERSKFSKKDNNYTIRFRLPGFDSDEVSVSVSNGKIDLRAEKKEKDEAFDNFYYSTTLPLDADTSSVDALLKNGVLTVVFAVKQAALPPKSQVKIRTE